MNDEMKAWELAGVEGWTGYDSQTNQIRSISGSLPICIHGPKCFQCRLDAMPKAKYILTDEGTIEPI